jgi:Spy/CpxP family protein refolding chaperone
LLHRRLKASFGVKNKIQSMKKIVLSVLAFSVVLSVKAQEIPERKTDAPPMHHRKDREGMRDHRDTMKDLNLTDTQKDQFKKERESFHQQMDVLKKKDDITVKEWRSRMENLRKEHKSRIDGILTTEQKQHIEKLKVEGRARHEDMMKKRGEEMKTRLGLTDEQSAKLKKNHEDMEIKMKAIREDKSLSEEKKREAVKDLMKSNKDALKSILTEEQMKKMKEERMERPKNRDERKDRKPEKKETI